MALCAVTVPTACKPADAGERLGRPEGQQVLDFSLSVCPLFLQTGLVERWDRSPLMSFNPEKEVARAAQCLVAAHRTHGPVCGAARSREAQDPVEVVGSAHRNH